MNMMKSFNIQNSLKLGHKSSNHQYNIFGAQNYENADKSSNVLWLEHIYCDKHFMII